MSWRPPGEEDEDEDFEAEQFGDEVADEKVQFTKRDSIIFLIDYQPSMHVKNEEGVSMFQRCLAIVARIIKDKIICSEDDYIGICFYGTEQRKNSGDFNNVYVWGDMDTPDAPRIKELEELAATEKFDLIGKPHTGKISFHYALWAANNMFTKSHAKDDARKIYIFTNNDDPVKGDAELRQQAKQKAADLVELDIAIELFPESRDDAHPFDFTKFFMNVVTVSDPDDEDGDGVGFNPHKQMEKIQELVARKKHKRRSQGRVHLTLGNGIDIGLKLFCMVRVTTKQKFELLDKRNNGTIQVNTQWLCTDTCSLLQPADIQLYSKFCDSEKICFSRQELVEIKQPCPAGIKLIGFKPRTSLRNYHNIKPSNFVYPADDMVKGSTTAFVALLDKCLEFDRIMIVRVTSRRNASPKIAALLPQEERNDGEVPIPGGFQLIWLPFADDIRKISVPIPEEVTVEAVDAARNLVTSINIDFSSTDFDNPALQQHYATLQALALNEDSIPAVDDVVVPDEEGLAAHMDAIQAFRDAAYPRGYSEPGEPAPKKTTGAKRGKPDTSSAGDGAGGGGGGDGGGAGGEDWADLVRTNKIAKKTIPDLKVYLQANGLKVSGKKDDLVARIKEHLGL